MLDMIPKPVLGVLAILLLFAVIGFGIRWAMRAGDRLSRSGRDMGSWRQW
jgi:hypothetical protein